MNDADINYRKVYFPVAFSKEQANRLIGISVTKRRLTPENPVLVGQLGLITQVEPSGLGQGYAIVVNWGDDVFAAYDDWVDFSVDTRLH